MLNSNEKAYEYFRMINPIEHTRTREEARKYKVEPYVIPADIYGQGNLAGRGGWTWYTGSSSWMFVAGIKYILGLEIKNGYLSINPHIPQDWGFFEIKYKYKNSVYNIRVEKNNNNVYERKIITICNGKEVTEGKVKLKTEGIFNIEVFIN